MIYTRQKIATFIHKRLVFCLCECKPNCYTLYQNLPDYFDKPYQIQKYSETCRHFSRCISIL